MLKLQKLGSTTLAFALIAAPATVGAQIAEPAGPMANSPADMATPASPPQAGTPAQSGSMSPPDTMSQPDTTDVPASEPAMQPQAQAPADTSGDPQVAAFVDQQFGEADANGDGVLTPEEFKPWMAQLKAAEAEGAGQTVDAAETQTYASNAFTAADVDGDGKVSKVELTQFFSQA